MSDPKFEDILDKCPQQKKDSGKLITKKVVPTEKEFKITFDGVVVNPPEGRVRKDGEPKAFEAWCKAAVMFNKTLNKKGDRHSPEARKKEVEKRRAERKSTAAEAKGLIWWITFSAYEGKARFKGDRQAALDEVTFAFQMADEWLEECEKKNIEEPTRITEDEPTEKPKPTENPEESDEPEEGDEDVSSSDERDSESEYVIDERVVPTVQRKQVKYRKELHEFAECVNVDLRMDNMDYKDKYHWTVVCLEEPKDMNVFVKRKHPMDKGLLLRMLQFWQIGLMGAEQDGEGQKIMNWQVVREQRAFSIARYLSFGYCSDDHKSYADVDKQPLIGNGDIDIPVNNLRTWLQHSIELAGHRTFSDMHYHVKREDRTGEGRTWFTAITCRSHATRRMFEDLKVVLLGDDDKDQVLGARSTPQIRQQKLEIAARRNQSKDEVAEQTLFIILAWQCIDPIAFRTVIYESFFGSAKDKQQIMVAATPSSGKSALFNSIACVEGHDSILIGESLNHTTENKNASLKFFQALGNNRKADVIMFPEFGKLLESGHLTATMAYALLEDSSVAQDSYLRNLARLPCLCFNQTDKLEYATKDKKSLKERLDILSFHGQTLPMGYSTDGSNPWEITSGVMARFLLGKMDIPEWFNDYTIIFKKLQAIHKENAPVEPPSLPKAPHDAWEVKMTEFREWFATNYTDKFFMAKFPNLWNMEAKAATKRRRASTTKAEPIQTESADALFYELFGADEDEPTSKRSKMQNDIADMCSTFM